MRSDSDVSTAAWAVAGLPLLATLLQTVLALLNWTSEDLGVNGLLSPVYSLDVVYQAAVVFKSQPAVVTVLFLLIAAAWVVQGAAMRVWRNRDVAVAAAGFASVTYLALFFGVYSALFDRGVGAPGLVAFFAIPLVASALIVGAALLHDWSEDVIDRASGDLGDLEVAVADAREAFDAAFESRLGDLSDLEAVAPSGVAEARSKRTGFHERCDDLLADIESVEGTDDPDRLRAEVSRLESRVDGLTPRDAVESVAADLRRRVSSGVRTQFGGFGPSSRFGGSYTLSNLPTEYRETGLPPDGGSVHVEDLGDVLARRLDSGESLSTVGPAVAAASAHRDRVTAYLEDREAEVADRVRDVESRLDTVDEQAERLPGGVERRVRDVLVENRADAVEGAAGVRRDVRDAKAALHDCRFDDADRLLSEAESASARLVSLAEFLRSLDGRLKHGGSDVDVPQGVDADAVAAVAPAFASHYDRSVSVTDGRVEVGGEDDGEGDAGEETVTEAAAGDASDEAAVGAELPDDDIGAEAAAPGASAVEKRPEEVLDSALYFLRELEEHAREAGDSRVQFQTGDLPPGIGTPDTLANVEQFLSRQPDLFEEVRLQSAESPSFFEAVVVDGERPAAAFRTARDRFEERYA